MRGVTIFEYESVGSTGSESTGKVVPANVFDWLESLSSRVSEEGGPAWLRLTTRKGHRAIQFRNYAGVLRVPNGFQIEVLPKIGQHMEEGQSRRLLLRMLKSLNGFRHIQTDSANLEVASMPLFEVFVAEFLSTVDAVVKRGLRSDYILNQGNLFTLRGKLLVSKHLRQNLIRPERFHTEHDDFSINRPENRLLHLALRRVLTQSTSRESLRLAQELCFRFADVPESNQIRMDFQKVRLDRGMAYYQPALAWAKLIVEGQSPLTGIGDSEAPSLLFPMDAVFEAYVEKHLAKDVADGFNLKRQARTCFLVEHQNQNWFLLKPDLLVREGTRNRMVMDAKWKLLDSKKANAKEKYGLSQSDFYQLYAYGHHYLGSEGDVLLIYPMTDAFQEALPPFSFPQSPKMKLWVLPFDLETGTLVKPVGHLLQGITAPC